jgi:uncharacterized membrane protein
MAALSYPIPLLAIVVLLVEEMKSRPFQRYHAVQAFVVNIILWIVIAILSTIVGAISLGLCGFFPTLLWFVTLYWAWQAYQGLWLEIPWLTQFLQRQKWL